MEKIDNSDSQDYDYYSGMDEGGGEWRGEGKGGKGKELCAVMKRHRLLTIYIKIQITVVVCNFFFFVFFFYFLCSKFPRF